VDSRILAHPCPIKIWLGGAQSRISTVRRRAAKILLSLQDGRPTCGSARHKPLKSRHYSRDIRIPPDQRDCVVALPVPGEPCLSVASLFAGNLQGKSPNPRRYERFPARKSEVCQWLGDRIPCATERGIKSAYQGKRSGVSGNLCKHPGDAHLAAGRPFRSSSHGEVCDEGGVDGQAECGKRNELGRVVGEPPSRSERRNHSAPIRTARCNWCCRRHPIRPFHRRHRHAIAWTANRATIKLRLSNSIAGLF
jgi:hypothetical protein